MSDVYTELLVLRKRSILNMGARVGLIILVVLFCLGAVNGSLLLFLGALAAGILFYVLNAKAYVEYEYELVNHEFRVDCIYGKKTRKHKRTFDLEQAAILAPVNSPELRQYENLKTEDYSAGDSDHRPYVMVITQDGQSIRLLLQLEGEILEKTCMFMGRRAYK